MTSLSPHRLPAGVNTLTLSNNVAEVVVLPDKGADIYSFTDLASGVDVLLKAPWGVRVPGPFQSGGSTKERWMQAYPGGWQVLLPNGGEECVERDATWGYHGEAAVTRWDVLESSPTRIQMETRLFSVPFHVDRTLVLDGPVLRLHETVTNESPETIEFMWSHHPAFGAPFLDGQCVLSTGFRSVVVDDVAPNTLLVNDSRHDWPVATARDGHPVDLSQMPGPDEPRALLAYLVDMESPFYAITSPARQLGVALRWSPEIFNKAWLWQEVHSGQGFPWYQRCYALAIEPCSTIPGHGMVYARSKGESGVTLDAHASKSIEIEAVLFHSDRVVTGVEPGGTVSF